MPTTLGASIEPSTPSGLADAAILNGYVNNARDTASQALTGAADAGASVAIYDGATLLGTTTADGGGAWSYTLGRLLDGPHSLTAVASDALGHLSAASAALAFKVDTRPPSQPGGLVDASIAKGLVNAAHNTADQTLTGRTDAGATVAIFDAGTQIGTVKAGATGAWSFTLGQLAEGAHKLTATASDVAGNTSASSDVLAFTVDTHAPGAPSGLADNKIIGGYVNAGHDLANQALTGKAQAYAMVAVYDGATKLGQVQASGAGDWSYTLGKLADGDHSLTATAADKAGNISAASDALAFTVDTQAPGLYVIEFFAESISGFAEPGASVTISEGATTRGSVVVDADGGWSVALSGLADTPHTFTVSAVDPAGNKATTTLPMLYHGGLIVFGDGDIVLSGHAAAAGETLSNPYSGPYLATSVGDVRGLSDHALGGDDTVAAGGFLSSLVIGDAFSIADYARGGDDVVTATRIFRFSTGVAYGDAETMSGHAVGGNDTVTAATALGDAQSLRDYAQGGDDLVTGQDLYPYFTTSLYGDGAELLGHARGGDDTLVGSASVIDLMWGDAATVAATATTGADLFVVRTGGGKDQIMDFQPGKDRIELTGLGFSGFADLSSHFETTADGVLITEPDDDWDSILLRGVTVAQLNADDFVFS
jgi:hypothetical protein